VPSAEQTRYRSERTDDAVIFIHQDHGLGLLIAVFAPIAFAGAIWDHTRIWLRRWIEIVAALVFCKVVIVVVFVVGASAFGGVGPATPDAPASPPSGDPPTVAGSLSDLLVGLLLLSIAVFSPWLTWRFVHWSGMEAASVMGGSMAASPLPNAVRVTGSQARFMAQSAAMSMLAGGLGAAARSRPLHGGGNGAGPAATPPHAPVPPLDRRPSRKDGDRP